MAGRTDQGDDCIVDGFGKGGDDGAQVRLKRVDQGLLDGLHDLFHGGDGGRVTATEEKGESGEEGGGRRSKQVK